MRDADQMVELGLFALGEILDECGLTEGSPASNTGAAYEGETFAMRAFCWCDGGLEGHEDECPPNFEHYASNFRCEWYKHASRGPRQSRSITGEEWAGVLRDCLGEVISGGFS